MDVFTTPGAFSWSELQTTDPEGAKIFYGKLFGWSTRDRETPNGKYTTCQVGEQSVAGIVKMPADAPSMQPAWGCFVTVKDVDETLALAASLGGRTVMSPTDVPGVGRMAVLQDPQGALLSIITYAMPSG
jgi:predicted enzyme related to lactoylglutathione lyase